MRTTIDLPDVLYREIKAKAALRGMKLKDFVAAALRDFLRPREASTEVRESETTFGVDVLVLREDCVFPLIVGPTGDEMRSLSEQRIDEILEEEDIELALRSR